MLFWLLHSLQVSTTYGSESKNYLNQFKRLNFAEPQLVHCWCVRKRLCEASLPTNRAVYPCGRYAGSCVWLDRCWNQAREIQREWADSEIRAFLLHFWSTPRVQSPQVEKEIPEECCSRRVTTSNIFIGDGTEFLLHFACIQWNNLFQRASSCTWGPRRQIFLEEDT